MGSKQIVFTAGERPADAHWHPKSSSRPGSDGRIHALEGYRNHVDPMNRNRRGTARLCDDYLCQICMHDCDCLRCSGWCFCDDPPHREFDPAVPAEISAQQPSP